MSRIRSIHPGLWTDEAFATLPDAAGLLYIGLLNEADDNGVFEWKPVTIKMRLKPASALTPGEIEATLTAIEQSGMIQRFAAGGKHYGAVRNFVRWQRPKRPKAVHPMPSDITFLGFDADGKRPRAGTGRPSDDDEDDVVPNTAGTSSEQTRQREDEGGRREEGEEGRNNNPPSTSEGGDGEPIATEPKARAEPERTPDEIPAAFDRRVYPEAFEALWEVYRPIAAKNATKADACAGWRILSEPDKAACLDGLRLYAAWLGEEAQRRDGTKVKHLATFIEKRAWEPLLEARPAARSATLWVPDDDERWPVVAERWRAEKGKPPPAVAGSHGARGQGWHFPAEWVAH